MRKTQLQAVGVLIALACAFGGGIYAGNTLRQQNVVSAASGTTTFAVGSATQPQDVDMTQFWEAYSLLNQNFIVAHTSSTFPTKEKQIYGAIAGLTESFGDPYTVFLPPSDAQIFQEDISGSFGGVGMQIDHNAKGQLTVVSPLKGTPAAAAGIRSGDLILQIATTTTDGLSVTEAVKLIRGPKGTAVSLVLSRPGETKLLTISVVRDTINIPIINSYKRDDGIFVIELYSFSENSVDLFRDALRQFVQSGDTKLLLDVRGNPGGYLEAAVNMASYFLPVGSTVVTEDFKGLPAQAGKQNNVVHRSLGYNIFSGNKNFKMAILIDQGSASASEILAGALQQHTVARLVGVRTFGKGSVQQLMDLGGGAELKVTIARWLTPNGISISDGGLTPDIAAERSEADRKAGKDPQTDTAVIYLLNN
ncbi:MAG: S41 family peptidase [bacterium]|nr:S41 family peptidase [bacterium]